MLLEFTPLEFETGVYSSAILADEEIRIYSVGVWNVNVTTKISSGLHIRIYSVGVWNGLGSYILSTLEKKLEFTPLEFETRKK